MEQMRGGVGAADRGAAVGIHPRVYRKAQIETALSQMANVQHKSALSLRVDHFKSSAGPLQPPRVAHLSAGFAVERCLVEYNGHCRGVPHFSQGFAEPVLRNDAHHLAVCFGRFIAAKLRAVHRFFKCVQRARAKHLRAVARPRPLSVRIHRLAEACPVEGAVALGGQRFQEFGWKAIRCVQFGSIAAANEPCSRSFDRCEKLFDAIETAVDRREK